MKTQFATDAWMRATKLALGRSTTFRDVARNWRSDFYCVVKAGNTVPQDLYLYFDLRYGECVEAVRVSDPSQRLPEIVLEGSLEAWQRVFQKKLSLLQALMTKELLVTSGVSVKIMGAPKAAQEFINCLAAIDTEWPDDSNPIRS